MIFYFLLPFIIPQASALLLSLRQAININTSFQQQKKIKNHKRVFILSLFLRRFAYRGPVITSKNSAKINLPFVSFRP
jgi:hypothetical protein